LFQVQVGSELFYFISKIKKSLSSHQQLHALLSLLRLMSVFACRNPTALIELICAIVLRTQSHKESRAWRLQVSSEVDANG